MFILLGLALVIGNALRFLLNRPSAAVGALGRPQPNQFFTVPVVLVRGGEPSLWWPLLLLWLGFWLGTGFRTTLWMLAVLMLVLVAVGLGLHLLKAVHGRRDDELVSGPALAVLLTTGFLVLFGLLLTVRLEVVPDPSVGFLGAVRGDAAGNALSKVIVPAAALGLLLAVFAIKLRPGRIKFERPRQDWWHLAGLAVVFVLFAAPLAGDGQLTLAGIATPEYGKIVYLAVLAMMLADHAYGFRIERRPIKGDLTYAVKSRRHLLYPFVLFGVVGVASTLKSDIGPMIPVFAATVTMMWLVVRAEVTQALDVSRRRGAARSMAAARTAWTYTKPMVVPLLALATLGFLVMLTTSYITTRWETQRNPWVYNWAQSCVDVPDGPPDLPQDTAPCVESLAGEFASTHSQIAQSLATIADGGLWGRGLADTTSGRLPAGSTDLVLAVIWSKLGGVVVLLLAAVLALLAASLASLARPGRAASPERLFIGGFAGMLVVQFLFVLAATVNAVPHSGITAPFLSYGVQSTVALGAGVIVAVALHYRTEPAPEADHEPVVTPAPLSRLGFFPSLLAFLTCVMLALSVTVWPYTGLAENRPFCATARDKVDSTACSTDRIAQSRTSVELVIGGKPQYVRTGAAQTWEPLGQPEIKLDDLAGIVDGSTLSDALAGTPGTSLGTRLGPPATTTPGRVELSVDPAIQAATATALRTASGPTTPLAGGIVVLDSKSGQVLASASAPTESASTAAAPAMTQQMTDFRTAHQKYYHRKKDGTPDEARECADVEPEDRVDCVRWGLRADPGKTAAKAGLPYVGGRTDVTPPSPDVNRAFGQRYGLGSTFKVVVAATYLRQPNTTAEDVVPAPEVVVLGGKQIHNAGGSACPGTTWQGTITLTQALAVSCNTAFVQLAGALGWKKIEETATALGFSLFPADQEHAWLAGTAAGAASVVPKDLGPAEIGNAVLGGGHVEGTPLQMATVMAAIANDGKVVQPSLVTAVADANGGDRRPVIGTTRDVLTKPQAEQLRLALSATTTAGTAQGVGAFDGRPLWVKTGTHEVIEGDAAAPKGQFVRQIA
ncbi:MAG TPA: penicillin-binding transpeptidase domain-containing protein, partial [Lentzea sp.]